MGCGAVLRLPNVRDAVQPVRRKLRQLIGATELVVEWGQDEVKVCDEPWI